MLSSYFCHAGSSCHSYESAKEDWVGSTAVNHTSPVSVPGCHNICYGKIQSHQREFRTDVKFYLHSLLCRFLDHFLPWPCHKRLSAREKLLDCNKCIYLPL